jgi:hypothetical protein
MIILIILILVIVVSAAFVAWQAGYAVEIYGGTVEEVEK